MISVQLEDNGPITEMDERDLQRSDGIIDNENEYTTWVEYRLGERIVHRSVHISLKKGFSLKALEGKLG